MKTQHLKSSENHTLLPFLPTPPESFERQSQPQEHVSPSLCLSLACEQLATTGGRKFVTFNEARPCRLSFSIDHSAPASVSWMPRNRARQRRDDERSLARPPPLPRHGGAYAVMQSSPMRHSGCIIQRAPGSRIPRRDPSLGFLS